MNKRERPNAGMIQFINTTCPTDATSSRALSLIRSHAAKHSRAVQRQRGQTMALPRDQLTTQANNLGNKTLARWGDQEEEQEDVAHAHWLAWQESHRPLRNQPKSRSELRRLLPKQGPVPTNHAELVPHQGAPSPIQLIGGLPHDAYQGFARPLSRDEQYLFDFYLSHVILHGYKACHHKEDEAAFQASMRHVWVPFAMGQPSLMAAIFQVACRNYVAATSNEKTAQFAVKKLQYHLACLGMAKDAISSEAVASDATIALALLMASESHMEGDFEAFYTHGSGIIQMVGARGGLDKLGVSGFLTKSIGWSIYSPRNHLVLGPNELGVAR